MPSTLISSIGLANPPFKVSQSDIFSFMSKAHGLSPIQNSRLKKIYDLSGIQFRYSVLEDYSKLPGNFTFYGNGEELEPFPSTKKRSLIFETQASALGYKAAINCFNKLPDFRVNQISHIITVTCTGLHAPGLDIELVSKLGLKLDMERVSINFMGCYAGFNALKTADYICRSDPKNKVLIINVELCTLHFQKENKLQNWVSNALFGDGASAVLLQSDNEFPSSTLSLKLKGFYSRLLIEASKEMAWNIGDTGFEMQLGSHITKGIKSTIKSVATKILEKCQMDPSEIVHYAIHPGGRRILEVCEEELGFIGGSDHSSYKVLRNFGNMSSATIFYVLSDLINQMETGKLKRGDIMGFAFGPGLNFESMILEPSTS